MNKINHVKLLNRYILDNYSTQKEFLDFIGINRQKLHYILTTAETNNDIFPPKFLKLLHQKGVNIFDSSYTSALENNSNEVQEPAQKLLSSMQKLIESQQKTIDLLIDKLEGENHHKEAPKKRAV